MAFPRRRLVGDEQVLRDTHPHWRRLAGPVLVLLGTVPVTTYAAAALAGAAGGAGGGAGRLWVRWAVLATGALAVLAWAVLPYLRWLSTDYVVTDRRVVLRTGLLARRVRDVPLAHVTDVRVEKSLLDRALRSGTLVVESAAEGGGLVLVDTPDVDGFAQATGAVAAAGGEDRVGHGWRRRER
jgi:uncharacterized membrane protein YdbT with pleckstrin-like domain